MRVLVTGHLGYIGSVMTSVLRHAGHDVCGLDTDLFGGCDFGRTREHVPRINMDIRDVHPTDIAGFDAVIHLAALSDDSACDLAPELTRSINLDATVRLAIASKRAGAGLFLFASSCSVYGRDRGRLLIEGDQPNPLSRYARSKLEAEAALGELADETFSPVMLRNATVFGVSPRLRLDLVVNDFVTSAALTGRVGMRSVGTAWRPLVHVADLATAYAGVLAAPRARIHNQVFNVVGDGCNVRVIDLADKVVEQVSHSTRVVLENVVDPRSYRVSGEKLLRALSGNPFSWSLEGGIRQLREAFASAGLSPGDARSDRYRRVLRLKHLMGRGALDPMLRWTRCRRVGRAKTTAAA